MRERRVVESFESFGFNDEFLAHAPTGLATFFRTPLVKLSEAAKPLHMDNGLFEWHAHLAE